MVYSQVKALFFSKQISDMQIVTVFVENITLSSFNYLGTFV